MRFPQKWLFFIALSLLYIKVSSIPSKYLGNENKRNLYNFGTMVECETNEDKWRYRGYGCWCGFGGAGTPLDGTDRCCYEHDKCYDRLMAENSECTTSFDPYLASYKFGNCSICAQVDQYTTWDSIGWTRVTCRVGACECDSAAAKCFGQNVFNVQYSNYDKKKCGAIVTA